jgi:hypothetical protein
VSLLTGQKPGPFKASLTPLSLLDLPYQALLLALPPAAAARLLTFRLADLAHKRIEGGVKTVLPVLAHELGNLALFYLDLGVARVAEVGWVKGGGASSLGGVGLK